MDYAKRAYELGHRVITCMEHGYQGNYLKLWSLAESKEFLESFGDYPFKLVFGAEAYWVPDRLNKEDSSNRHICVFARNESGRRQITKMLTIANEDGFYRVPRVDLSLLMNLRPQDVLVTTACVSFWGKIPRGTQDLVWFDGIDDAFSMLAKHFGDSLYLEVQAHDSKWQRDVNAHALTLRDQYHVRLIAGMDSHYITPEQKQIRSWLREENGREINSEEGDHAFESCVYEDYPDESELRARFARQGILFQEAIDEAIESTDVFLTFDDLHFSKDKKLPNIYPDRTQEERNEMYLQLLRDAWKEYRKTIPRELWSRYEKAIIEEGVDTVVATNMSDYFLIDHALVKEAIRNGGEITKTGRGSGGSFFTNTLLGFSTLDRLSLPVTLYPSRFISKERLQAGSLPDLDMNVSDPEPFAAAQQKVMGEGHSYPMISYKPLKLKSAFRLFARVRNLPMELQNEISAQLDKYEKELRYAEDPDEVDVFDFVDEQYRDVIEGCRVYEGIIVSKSQAPCGYLIYDGDIRSEIGLVRVTSDTKKTSVLCTVIDGAMADLYGYLKNDILTVSVVKVNNQVMRECGVGQISAKELIELTRDDPATWEVFHKGWTVGINQCEREASRRKIVTYKPNNLTELSAFIAAIRPAFKSNLKQFLHREHFEYGIPALDHLLQTPEMPDSWILYQEQMMKVIAFAGFPLDETYSIVKAISKKHPEKVLPLKEKFLQGFSSRVMQEDGVEKSEADCAAEKVWQIISDACAYGFNACLDGDEVIWRNRNGHEDLTIEQMYLIKNNADYAKRNGHKSLHDKFISYGYGKAMSLREDGRIYKNDIVDIRDQGMKKTYKIILASGRSIVATENHKFPVGSYDNLIRLDHLHVGDKLICTNGYEKKHIVYRFTDNDMPSNLPQKGQNGFQKIEHPNSLIFYNERQRHIENADCCSMCGIQYDRGLRFELHHRDGDRTNNTPENYAWLCVSCHKKVHFREHHRKKHGDNGYPIFEDSIISIEEAGYRHVYDVEMAHPYHNFLLASGIVTGNSHAAAVALDAMYGAYLKSHYPLHYYRVLMETRSLKKDKEEANAAKAEMRDAYHIRLVPCKFGEDNRTFSIDPERNVIVDAMMSVKGLSLSTANAMYEAGKHSFRTFTDFLIYNDQHKCLDSGKLDTLITIGYFSRFGNAKTLRHIADLFSTTFKAGHAKEIARAKVDGSPVGEIISRYSTCVRKDGSPASSYTIRDMCSILYACEEWVFSLRYEDDSIREKIMTQTELMGYTDVVTGKEEDRRKLVILDLFPLRSKNNGDVWAYKLTTQSIGSGKQSQVTLRRAKYDQKPVKQYDVIDVYSCPKDKKGYFELLSYSIVKEDRL